MWVEKNCSTNVPLGIELADTGIYLDAQHLKKGWINGGMDPGWNTR